MPMAQKHGAKENTRKDVATPQEDSGAANNRSGSGAEEVRHDDSSTYEERLKAARQRVRDAEQWIQTFPRPWQYITSYLEMEYLAGHRISMQQAWEQLRAKEWSGSRGERFGLDNSLRPVLARMILLEHPEYMEKMEIRRSPALDDVMGFGR